MRRIRRERGSGGVGQGAAVESSRRQWRSRAVVSGGVGQGAAVEWDSGEVRKGTTRSQVKGGKGVAMQSR